ncbi:hypothetical protein DV737_g4075, partial [Chaetothyriales sp. CBS 132003]
MESSPTSQVTPDAEIAEIAGAGAAGFLRTLPLELLHAELQQRQDGDKSKCGTTGKQGKYNNGLHVFALVLILVLSTLACSFPIIARRFPSLPIPRRFLFLSRHFGTGVLIATAFIHLLPTAFVSLTDPCLPRFWNESYPPMAGAIAMTAVFVVVVIEMVFASKGARHSHESDWTTVLREEGVGTSRPSESASGLASPSDGVPLNQISGPYTDRANGEPGPPKQQQPRADDDDSTGDLDLEDLDAMDSVAGDPDSDETPFTHSHNTRHNSHAHRMKELATTTSDPKKLFLQCLLLEAGILFHSVFIGMAVSVATGTAFVVLLIAICFHQTFEGFALGSRIAALIPTHFAASSPKPWLMALAYGTTTPIGQAVGIWLHTMYDPLSQTGLLMVGITNAISSGLLLFAGLVQLIAEDFLSDESYRTLAGRRRIEASVAVGLGGLLMGVVGAFA